MKVCMIGHKQIPSRKGGVEIVVEKLSEELVKQGVEVTAYNRKDYSGKPMSEYKGIKIYEAFTLKTRSFDAIISSFFATVSALMHPYDIMHYHAEGPCLMLWLPHLFRKKIVVTIHGLDWKRAKWGNLASKMILFGEKQAVAYADEIIVLSRNVQEYFQNTYGRKTNYIPNGISKPEMKEAKIIKKKFGLEKESYILFLARIVPEKGLHYLIDAYQKMHTDKKLVIAGDSMFSEEYGKLIQKRCKNNKNIILTGFVEGDLLEELFSNAAVYVLPSEIEGMAISLLEAMSYGRCCLVSDIPENKEVIKDFGVTFKSSDVFDLKEKLELLLASQEKYEALGKAAQNYILGRFEWKNIAGSTIRLYEKIYKSK